MNDFLAQTRGLPYKEVAKYKVTKQCAPVLPADYSSWIEKIAEKELKECSYSRKIYLNKRKYWKGLMPEKQKSKKKPTPVPAAGQKP